MAELWEWRLQELIFSAEALASREIGAVTCPLGDHEFYPDCPECGARL